MLFFPSKDFSCCLLPSRRSPTQKIKLTYQILCMMKLECSINITIMLKLGSKWTRKLRIQTQVKVGKAFQSYVGKHTPIYITLEKSPLLQCNNLELLFNKAKQNSSLDLYRTS